MTKAPADLEPVSTAPSIPDDLEPVAQDGPAPAASARPSASVAPSVATPPPRDWHRAFASLTDSNVKLDFATESALTGVDATSENQKQGRAHAITRAFLIDRMPNVTPQYLDANWEATKLSYAKNEMGFAFKGTDLDPSELNPRVMAAIGRTPPGQISDETLAGLIDNALKEGDEHRSKLAYAWEEFNKPLIHLPKAPDDLPNLPQAGPNNPALLGAVYNGLKPFIEGVSSPVGIATLGVAPALKAAAATYPAAKAALLGMGGLFTGLMGHETVKNAEEVKRVEDDPNSSWQDKVTAWTGAVGSAAATVLGVLGVALEALPKTEAAKIVEQIKDKSPAEAAEVLREVAVTTDHIGASDFLHDAARELEKIPPPTVGTVAEPIGGGLERTSDGMVRPVKSAAKETSQPTEERATEPAVEKAEKEASPEEKKVTAETLPDDLVSIKNETMDKILADAGMEPAKPGERVKEKGLLADAQAAMEKDSRAGENLVEDLSRKIRPPTPQESALLTVETRRLVNERNVVRKEIADSITKGEGDDARASLRVRLAKANDAIFKVAQIDKQAGTQSGQSLALRKMMLKEDYSPVALERRVSQAKGGKLTESELGEVEKLSAQIKEAEAENAKLKAEKTAAEKALAEKPKGERTTARRAPPSRVSSYLTEQAAAARERIAKRAGISSSVVGDEGPKRSTLAADIQDYAIVGAELIVRGTEAFADWGAAMTKEFGDAIKPHLQAIFDKAHETLSSANYDSLLDRRKKQLESQISKLKKQIDEGDLSTAGEKASRPSIEEIETLEQQRDKLRDERNGMREQAAKIKELESAVAEKERKIADGDLSVKGSPANRPAPEAIERLKQERDALNKQIAEARKEAGKPSAAEVLDRKVEELQRKIAEKKAALKSGNIGPKPSAASRPQVKELEVARQELESLNAEIAEARKGPPKSKEEIRVEQLDRQITEVERQLKEGEVFPEGKKPAATSPEIAAREQRLAKLKEERDYERQRLASPPDPKSKEEISLQTRKANRAKRIAELEKQIATGDFSKPERTEPITDDELRRSDLKVAALKRKAEHMIIEQEEAARGKFYELKNLPETFSNYVRTGVLSTLSIVTKLLSFSITRPLIAPLQTAAGYGWSKLFPEAARKASGEGVTHLFTETAKDGVTEIPGAIRQEARAMAATITKGIREAARVLSGGETTLSTLYDPVRRARRMYRPGDLVAALHEALHLPSRMNEFERQLQRKIAHAIRNDVDPTNEFVKAKLEKESWDASKGAAFIQENRLSKAWANGIRTLASKDSAGELSKRGVVGAALLRSWEPITTVPVNIADDILVESSPIGLVGKAGATAAARAWNDIRGKTGGFKDMTDDQANKFMRLLAKGTIGSAFLYLGWANRDQLGGLHLRGEKRKPTDLRQGEMKVGDTTIPANLLHNTFMAEANIGASIGRLWSVPFNKLNPESYEAAMRVGEVAMGVVEEVPMAQLVTDLDKIFDPKQRETVLAAKAALFLVPGFSDYVARQTDKPVWFSPFEDTVQRKPDTKKGIVEEVKQNFESRIPGLRENVPESKAQRQRDIRERLKK